MRRLQGLVDTGNAIVIVEHDMRTIARWMTSSISARVLARPADASSRAGARFSGVETGRARAPQRPWRSFHRAAKPHSGIRGGAGGRKPSAGGPDSATASALSRASRGS